MPSKIFIENIIKLIEEDSDWVLTDIDDEIEKYKPKLDSSIVKDILMIFEKYPKFDFGIPGSLTHFIEKFENVYAQELILSLKRVPTIHTLLLLQRLINGTNNTAKRRILIDIYDKFYMKNNLSKELNDTALEYISLNEEKEKLILLHKIIKLHEDKKDYNKVLEDALDFISENTGDAEGLEVTESILKKWHSLGIINQNQWTKCIEQSPANRWL